MNDDLHRKHLAEILRRLFADPQTAAGFLERYLADQVPGPVDGGLVERILQRAERQGWLGDLLAAAREEFAQHPAAIELERLEEVPAPRLEKVVHKDRPMHNVVRLRQCLQELEPRICKLELRFGGEVRIGTGFLVGPEEVLTNHHVVEPLLSRRAKPAELTALFDYWSEDSQGVRYTLADNFCIASSPPAPWESQGLPGEAEPGEEYLDFALLRLKGRPGEERGWIAAKGSEDFGAGRQLYVLQHPAGAPLQVAFGALSEAALNPPGTRVRYQTNTEAGSSGSPCFNEAWEWVALHHGGDPCWAKLQNQGIPLRPILAHLEKQGWRPRPPPVTAVGPRPREPERRIFALLGGEGPIVLASAGDSAAGAAAARALGTPPGSTGELGAVLRALGQGRPLALIWSREASANPSVGAVVGAAMAQEVSTSSRRIFILDLDGAPAHPLLAGIGTSPTVESLRTAMGVGPSRRRAPQAIARPEAEDAVLRLLEWNGKLLLLGPREGGARTLAKQAIRRAGYREEEITWLAPPALTHCSAEEYFSELAQPEGAANALAWKKWILAKAKDPHLLVLLHDGGPQEHLHDLGVMLRSLLDTDRRRFRLLVVGGAPSAGLRFDSDLSIFFGIRTHQVPDLTEGEVAEILGQVGESPDLARELHAATGGHPGFLRAVLSASEPLSGEMATRLLSQSSQVRGALNRRLNERPDPVLGKKWRSSESVLRELLEGKTARKLSSIQDQFQFGEVRLYYDGLVRDDPQRGAVLRCEAVAIAAREALS